MKTLANLNKIVIDVLKENSEKDIRTESVQQEIATLIEQRYANLVKLIASDYLQKEVDKRSTLSTFEQLKKSPIIKP